MSFKSGVTTRVDNAQAILDALRSLTKKDVLVGIPEEDSEREDVPFGNAGIGYVNEYGSPAQNIPPRPHLIPGVKSVEEQTVPQLKAAAQAALDGNAAGAERALNRAGTLAANGVRRYMTITGFTPLADSTVEARARRAQGGNTGTCSACCWRISRNRFGETINRHRAISQSYYPCCEG